MTTDVFTPAPVYAVSGTGPYNLGHPFGSIADFVVFVDTGDDLVKLTAGTDFTLAPTGPATDGDITLDATVAATHAGHDLYIHRATDLEQGWQGTTAREVGLEAQLDTLARAAQDALRVARGGLRVLGETPLPLVAADRALPVWDATDGAWQNSAILSDSAGNASLETPAGAWKLRASDGSYHSLTVSADGKLLVDGVIILDPAGAGLTAGDILAALLTVDGAGSGLDADTLDGAHLADLVMAFAAAVHTHAASAITSGEFDPDRLPSATDTTKGAVEKSTSPENIAGVATDKFPDVAGVKEMIATHATDVQVFSASGTWTKPASGKIAVVEAWGAGGSGAFRSSGSAGGGGGGAYVVGRLPIADLGATETVTIGAGGSSRTTNGDGSNGGNTSFGAHVTSYGGAGGLGRADHTGAGGGGGGTQSAGSGQSGGNPGPGSIGVNNGGDSVYGGGGGGGGQGGVSKAFRGGASTGGGGGGGGGNEASGVGGDGGKSTYGGGGGGGGSISNAGGAGASSAFGGNGGTGQGTGGAATSGATPGGGGGGAKSDASGAGGDGYVRVTVF